MVSVSIIIPVYNAAEYLAECLDSVLNQTEQSLEVLCIDDGSTDNSLQILQKYQQTDSRVRVLTQKNQGSGPARNRGMREACGKYIAFLDADDFWHDMLVLQKIVRAADERSCNITGAFLGNFKNNTYERAGLHLEYFDGKTGGRWIDFREEQNCFYYYSYLYRREFLLNNNLFFPAYYRFQDPPFLTQALVRACSYYVVPVDWYCYRITYKNTFSTPEKTIDFLKGVLDVMELAKTHDLQKLSAEMSFQIDMAQPHIISGMIQGNREIPALLLKAGGYAAYQTEKPEAMKFIGDALLEKCQRRADAFRAGLEKADSVIIYGAGYYGNILLRQLEKMAADVEIVFAETDPPKENKVGGIDCMWIDKLAEAKGNPLVIIAVRKQIQPAVASNIKRLGFENYICLDTELMTALECMG